MGFWKTVKEEITIIRERDPAIHSNMEVFLYPSFRVMLSYRRAHRLYEKGHYFWARWISQRAARKSGIEIHPGAQIGKGLFIDHGSGVIIGETTIIGDNCTLYQGVTLGGTGKEQGKRHPTLGNNVMVSAGAKVLGSFKVGDNSKIGAGAVVIKEVPDNASDCHRKIWIRRIFRTRWKKKLPSGAGRQSRCRKQLPGLLRNLSRYPKKMRIRYRIFTGNIVK